MKALFLAALAASSIVCASALATPLQDCAGSATPTTCLDAKLKAANQQLNATLKAAQERLEQMQAKGKRPVIGAFIDSQRKFNAYRDAQCNWQGVRAPNPAASAEYVKDCQIRATLDRERELAEFVSEEPAAISVVPTQPDAEAKTAKAPEPAVPPPVPVVEQQPGVEPVIVKRVVPEPVAADTDKALAPAQTPSAAPADAAGNAPRGNEWRLVKWIANGTEKTLVPDSVVTVAFAPSGKVSGDASVNRFSGTYRFDVDGRLRWPPSGFAVTRMAGPPALMTQERAFLDSLRRTSLFKIDGQQLVLESANSATVLTFTR
ncbi:MAG TPA: META domain-containing protein [Burkholderiales bacterium]|nr:META domain-containing protein [Burkholderiales bacterium]